MLYDAYYHIENFTHINHWTKDYIMEKSTKRLIDGCSKLLTLNETLVDFFLKKDLKPTPEILLGIEEIQSQVESLMVKLKRLRDKSIKF